MTELPQGWRRPGWRERRALARRFRLELDPADPAHRSGLRILAAAEGEDSVLAETKTRPPRYLVLHLDWGGAPPRAAHELASLSDLAHVLGPDPDALASLHLWTRAATAMGAVLIGRSHDGAERLLHADPGAPGTTAALLAAGWAPVTGDLIPTAEDGSRTGNVVEFRLCPAIPEVWRIVHTPGEAASARRLHPADSRIVEFDTAAEIAEAFPPPDWRPFLSPESL